MTGVKGSTSSSADVGQQEVLHKLSTEVATLKRRVENPVLDPEARRLVMNATAYLYELDDKGERVGVGVAFFISATAAVTCHHCLIQGTTVGMKIQAAIRGGSVPRARALCFLGCELEAALLVDAGDGDLSPRDIELTVAELNEEMDSALLTSAVSQPYLELCEAPPRTLVGCPVALCSYHLGLREELHDFEPHGIAVTPVREVPPQWFPA